MALRIRVSNRCRPPPAFRHKYEQHETVDIADSARLPDDQLADDQAKDLLSRALQEMEFDRRGVFVMHELEGHPIPEVARTFGIPLNTAYSRLRLARRDLESAIERLTTPKGEVHP